MSRRGSNELLRTHAWSSSRRGIRRGLYTDIERSHQGIKEIIPFNTESNNTAISGLYESHRRRNEYVRYQGYEILGVVGFKMAGRDVKQ